MTLLQGARSVIHVSTIYLDQIQRKINTDFFYSHGITGKGVRIAILDTGINSGIPMLSGKVYFRKEITQGKNMMHGTAVASICSGNKVTFGGREFSGIAPGALIADIKVLDGENNTTHSDVMEGIYSAALDAKADIINLSLGSDYDDGGDSPLSRAVDWASNRGIIVVASSGNSRIAQTPATAMSAIAVGSSTFDDYVSSFSGSGPAKLKYPYPTIVSYGGEIEPEEGILAAGIDGYYSNIGTSFSTPIVSGTIALFIEYFRKRGIKPDWRGIKELLSENVIDISPEGIDSSSGFGVLKIKDYGLASYNPSGNTKEQGINIMPLLALAAIPGIFFLLKKKKKG